MGIDVAVLSGMAEPENEQVSKKVVYEHVSSTSSGNSVAAWVIIGIVAVALIVFIAMRMG
jgi:hypothetical protein